MTIDMKALIRLYNTVYRFECCCICNPAVWQVDRTFEINPGQCLEKAFLRLFKEDTTNCIFCLRQDGVKNRMHHLGLANTFLRGYQNTFTGPDTIRHIREGRPRVTSARLRSFLDDLLELRESTYNLLRKITTGVMP